MIAFAKSIPVIFFLFNIQVVVAQADMLQEAKRKYYDGDVSGALTDITNILNRDPGNETAWYERGRIYNEQKKYINAINDFTKVVELNPKHHKAYYLRGYTKYMTGNWQGAVSDFNLSLDLYSNSALAFWYRAESKLKLGDVVGACEDWDKAYRLGYFEATQKMSDNCKSHQLSVNVTASAYLRKGDERLDKKDAIAALEFYNKALELTPDSPEVIYSIGLAKDMLNKKSEACEAWRKAASLGSPESKEMLKQHCN